ncbi:RHS repeat-associated core domain-containing protein [Melittangium boletus]|uniref:RHS repeat-associated core domain-containing protein n=1 Tax=Melittangium boletus TaxID=83453 RepID=UPI003DA490E4
MHSQAKTLALAAALSLLPTSGVLAQTSTSLDARVQAPQLLAPQRGSLTGQLSGVVFGPGDVNRGSFTLAAPMALPTERGAPLAQVLPGYSTEHGISEWGTGWQTSLVLTRSRLSGTLDYATDGLVGPHGRLVQGSDGFWYPEGLSQHVRVDWTGDVLTAYLPDGTKETYGGAARLATAHGTYAWYLTSVETPTGTRTRLDWTANDTGRLFLSTVWYGGLGTDAQYRVDFAYESLSLPFEDYRSRQRVTLDRRVKSVTVNVKHALSGLFVERWHDTLSYTAEGFGPGFFLTGVQRTFASGDTAPPTSYTYHLSSDSLAAAQLLEAPKLDSLLSTLGPDVLQPNRSSLLDQELNGLTDLEHNTSFRLLRQTAQGFSLESLPAAPADTFLNCRPPSNVNNAPRVLAQLRSGSGDDTDYVVDLRANSGATATSFSACNRVGQRLGGHSLPGNWTLGATTRLVDVDQDHQPDLVRIQNGLYRILPNTSTPTTFSFGTEKQGSLTPAFTPDTAWVHDFNGDGLADLIARYSNGIVVWYGKGHLDFERTGQTFAVRRSDGTSLGSLASYAFSFIDANKDGLTDLVLTQTSNNTTTLFMNRGRFFQETSVAALRGVSSQMSRPVVSDFSGSGNTELAYSRNGKGYAIALDSAGTGLMRTANDGKGTQLSFQYARAEPFPGGRQRNTVLSQLQVESSGYDTTTYTYAHSAPTVHSVGKFLVGFGSVVRTGPGLVHEATFLNGDHYAGLPSSFTQHDTLSPDVHTYAYHLYEDALYQGVPWKRLKEDGNGWAQQDGQTVGERLEYLEYEAEVCPSKAAYITTHGTLTTEKWRASPTGLTGHLHCMESRTRITGTHGNAALDFQNEVRFVRNALGLVEQVEDVSSTGDIQVLQDLTYRSDFLIDHVSVPGKGTTSFIWQPGTQQLTQVVSPDGVRLEASERDPVTSMVRELKTWRGTQAYTQSFRFDGQERLSSQWDNQGGASALLPNTSLEYTYATALKPGNITTSSLVDADTGTHRTLVEWQTAAGEAVANGARIPEGWLIDGLTTRSRNTLTTTQYARPVLGVSTIDYAGLLAGADVIGTLTTSGLGFDSNVLSRLHADVSRQVSNHLSLDAGVLKQESTENGTHTTRHFFDAQKKTVGYEDEAGTLYTYQYDALGRLRAVLLPGGTAHRVDFDGHGRVSRVKREGLAQVLYHYQSGTGLLQGKSFLSMADQASRREDYTYDAKGRRVLTRHTNALSGATQDYRFYYDGATPSSAAIPEATGLLSAVEGEGYLKRFDYTLDGKLAHKSLRLNDWRTVETWLVYHDDGSLRQQQLCHRQADGTYLSCAVLTQNLDAFGRLDAVDLNGQLLADLQYNTQGQLSAAALANGGWVTFSHDALTRAQSGFTQTASGLFSSTAWRFNTRGLIGTENMAIGGLSHTRVHTYSPQGFLASSGDAQNTYAYEYAASGLPSRIEENGVSRVLAQPVADLTAGNTTYTFDALGRTTSRDDLTFTYGPNGHLSRAARGAHFWDYLYDEAGERIFKSQGGVPVAAYLESGAYLDDTGLTLPFKVGGRLAGLIHNGIFRPLAADRQGSVLSDFDGTARFASPYGVRSVHPESSAALDYVEKGYDRDTGLIRMGVRDYDAYIGRFTTPDPLFLESPDQCVTSPTECNLYAYARSNPLAYTDPDGRKAKQEPPVASNFVPQGAIQPAVTEPVGLSTAGYIFGIGIEMPGPSAITSSGETIANVDTGGPGHAFAYWKTPDGKIAEVLSFGPSDDDSGMLENFYFLTDTTGGKGRYPLDGPANLYEWTINQAQFDSGVAFSKAIKATPGYYTKERNCTTIAVDAAKASGVSVPEGRGGLVLQASGVTTYSTTAPTPYSLNRQLQSHGFPHTTQNTVIFMGKLMNVIIPVP